jgi:hypothetical protein
MNNLIKKVLFLLPLVAAFSSANATPITNVQDYSTQTATTYFLNPANVANPAVSPYYRNLNQDWNWTHGTIAGTFSAATLQIAAYDVDRPGNQAFPANPSEEHDIISLWNGTNYTSIGELDGNDNIWAFTTFDLTPLLTTYSWLPGQITSGLQVAINIDAANTQSWLVTLNNSVLSVDGGSQTCSPTPGVPCTNVPEPESLALFCIGFAGFALNLMRRRKV